RRRQSAYLRRRVSLDGGRDAGGCLSDVCDRLFLSAGLTDGSVLRVELIGQRIGVGNLQRDVRALPDELVTWRREHFVRSQQYRECDCSIDQPFRQFTLFLHGPYAAEQIFLSLGCCPGRLGRGNGSLSRLDGGWSCLRGPALLNREAWIRHDSV